MDHHHDFGGPRRLALGDVVIARWDLGNYHYVGTIVDVDDGEYVVMFEDGDRSRLTADAIRPNDVRVGSKVLARWNRAAGFYPGRVARIVGRALFIHFDDGDVGWVPWSWIALP